MTVLKVTENFK